MKTPDEEVAEKILQQFRKTKLLSEKGIQKISKSLAQGMLRPEDWRLILETDRLGREDDDVGKSH
jgi:hypothetical protein